MFSAPEGPDPLSEELKLVRNMDLASKEERYIDAGIQTVLDGIYLYAVCFTDSSFLFGSLLWDHICSDVERQIEEASELEVSRQLLVTYGLPIERQ